MRALRCRGGLLLLAAFTVFAAVGCAGRAAPVTGPHGPGGSSPPPTHGAPAENPGTATADGSDAAVRPTPAQSSTSSATNSPEQSAVVEKGSAAAEDFNSGTHADPTPGKEGKEENSGAGEQEPGAPRDTEGAPEGDGETKEQKISLRDICRIPKPGEEEPFLDASRRRLQQTFCGATLWVDGLLGGQPDPENAREVSGRLEITPLYREWKGLDPKVRLRVRYDLPNLENRVSVFLGRDDEEEVVQDRKQGIPIRSAVFGIDTEDRWLAGLGYRPPGKWKRRLDFSLGGQLRSAPEVYLRGRWQRNLFFGERSVLRLRESIFWQNRDGFGSTARIAVDRVVGQGNLLRFSNIGTISEESHGLEWGSAMLFYQRVGEASALAYEAFVRGATDHEVELQEYGFRGVYRRPMFRRWFYGQMILGYSWPREFIDEPRDGSTTFGVGIEIQWGENPY